MGIHVIQSQRIEVLVQGILSTRQQASRDPFAVLQSQHFIVPSAAVQEWLTQRLSEAQGISANTIFHQRIRGFQWYAYQQVLTDKDKVRKANIPRLIMKWRIFQVIKPLIQPVQLELAANHPMYPLIARIYESAARLHNPVESEQKKLGMLYWIADQVSKLFSHYMLYRADCRRACVAECQCSENWLAAWGRNQPLGIEQQLQYLNDQDASFKFTQAQQFEQWQRWLWLHTFQDDFVEMQSIDQDFWSQLEHPETRQRALQQLPKRVTVFTVLDLPPSQLQFLRRLGQYLDVLILHYNPSQEYWADSVDPNWKKQYDLGLKERFIARYQKTHQRVPTDADVQQYIDQFNLTFNGMARESRHPLLTRLGKQARDHFSLLSTLSAGEEGQWIDAFVDHFPEHILGRIQSDILHLVEPQAQSYPLQPEDDSIRIHVCHSTMRQLEVLKEQLIHWLAQGTPEHPRQPSDILVLSPDIKQIEPLVRSIFPQRSVGNEVYLPVKLAGVTQLDVSLAWKALLGRMTMIQQRFSIDDFADWLNLGASQLRYQLDVASTERILQLLQQAGFKRGLDEQHLRRSLAENDEDFRFSFKYAVDRLALGVAIPVHTVFEQTLSFAQVLSSDFELVAKLLQIYQDFDQRRDWIFTEGREQDQGVEDWLHVLLQEISEFEQAGVTVLGPVREIIQKQIRMLTLANFYDEEARSVLQHMRLPLPYLLNEIENTLESRAEQALPTGQITFSQIGIIRPLPYKLVVLLNLDGGTFPNRDTHLPFDLMELLQPQLGDRSRLEDDQGAFLDALLLAQDNLWLFYNGFDVSDGEARDPSSTLQELVQHLNLIVQDPEPLEVSTVDLHGLQIPANLRSLYRVHCLQPFDPLGFTDHYQRLQDHWFAVAQQLGRQQPRQKRQPWINSSYPVVQEQQILDAEQWIKDICFPARLYLKTLGVDNIRDQELPDIHEPLLLDGLGRYVLRDYLQQFQQRDGVNESLLADVLPVTKTRHATLRQSVLEHTHLQKRLQRYAAEPSQVTRQPLSLDALLLQIDVPVHVQQDWISMTLASSRAQRRAHLWLQYLLWLVYADLPEDKSRALQRIQVFQDNTIICTGLSAGEARAHLQPWLEAYAYAQSQPLVLPAALLMKPAVEKKDLEWQPNEQGKMSIVQWDKLLAEWNKSDAFLSYRLTQSEESKLHRDWEYLLQDQDATALLQWACDEFSYALYQPIYLHQHEAED